MRNIDHLHKTTVNRSPENYKVVSLKTILKEFLNREDLFVPPPIVHASIRANREKVFPTLGTLKEVKLHDMLYYQDEVGIIGPKHTQINEPKFVLEQHGSLILYDGYHRTLQDILNERPSINTYVLTIDEQGSPVKKY